MSVVAPRLDDPSRDGLEIIIRGKANRGKTTVANILAEELRDAGFQNVTVHDAPPSSTNKEHNWQTRLKVTQARSIIIRVEVEP